MVTMETKAPREEEQHSCLSFQLTRGTECRGHCLVLEQGSAVHCRLLFHQRESQWPEVSHHPAAPPSF